MELKITPGASPGQEAAPPAGPTLEHFEARLRWLEDHRLGVLAELNATLGKIEETRQWIDWCQTAPEDRPGLKPAEGAPPAGG